MTNVKAFLKTHLFKSMVIVDLIIPRNIGELLTY